MSNGSRSQEKVLLLDSGCNLRSGGDPQPPWGRKYETIFSKEGQNMSRMIKEVIPMNPIKKAKKFVVAR
jgi:hypothetical protein